ncbi:hypothetical protein GGD64_002766 [Bradyrhizobium sp. CIR3A]|nr:hypothetical protein [Bradyrhizobium sp. CIR3A]
MATSRRSRLLLRLHLAVSRKVCTGSELNSFTPSAQNVLMNVQVAACATDIARSQTSLIASILN